MKESFNDFEALGLQFSVIQQKSLAGNGGQIQISVSHGETEEVLEVFDVRKSGSNMLVSPQIKKATRLPLKDSEPVKAALDNSTPENDENGPTPAEPEDELIAHDGAVSDTDDIVDDVL